MEPVTNTVDFLNLDAPREDIGGAVLMPGDMTQARFGWMPNRPR
ncbi:aldose epimerase family protein [Caballeronia sordidicola]|uniref:Aldose epimerase family protein n=1 Tax=Caballeronia sordidicola TaxID=196367 RepID=A0A226WPX0_CABSO|nr:aldose epimerase family protein [Caballeronia sordidicola]